MIDWYSMHPLIELIRFIKHIEDSPSITLKLVALTALIVWTLTLEHKISTWMWLGILDHMPCIVHETILHGCFKILLRIDHRHLSVLCHWPSIVEHTIYELHVACVSVDV